MANLHLQSSIQAAKALQVPKDRIEDAIKCATKESAEDVVNMRYDGHLNTPSGRVAVILTALTDNKNRTAANVRSTVRKSNGELLNTGTNDWMFDHVGIALVHKQRGFVDVDDDTARKESFVATEEDEEELLECALDGGASDVDFGEPGDEHALVKCEPTDLHPLVIALKEGTYNITEFEYRYIIKDSSSNSVSLDRESSEDFQKFLDKMDEDEDVQNIFHNAICFDDES